MVKKVCSRRGVFMTIPVGVVRFEAIREQQLISVMKGLADKNIAIAYLAGFINESINRRS